VAKVSDIENAGGYLWVSAPITKVGVNEISVNIDAIINGNYRVYVANDKGVLSAASLNMVVVSMPRLYDRPAAQDFVMTLDTTLSDDNTVALPLGGTFDVTVNWGDGTSVETFSYDGDGEYEGEAPSHVYENEGTYTIQISGALERFGSDGFGWVGLNMVTTVTSFGTLGIESLSEAFVRAENLIQVPTELPTSVTNMSNMFALSTFNGDIGGWNVSNVTDMSFMFFQATVFNQNIARWDVSNVTNMGLMFAYASSFNQDIGGWNVSNVANMYGIFGEASTFNGAISDWDVSNVTDMSYMFYRALAFNQNIGSWNVSEVTQMPNMFKEASAFNQNIGSWNVSEVTNMSDMFNGATAFNQDLENWDVSEATDTALMFVDSGVAEEDLPTWYIAPAG
jgi:surface protein